MSQAYAAGVRDHLPKARVTFDRYHVKQHLSEAVDTVRKAEAKQHKELLEGHEVPVAEADRQPHGQAARLA